jgi:hypothetical protein
MTLHQWLGIAMLLLLAGFFVFAFRAIRTRPE